MVRCYGEANYFRYYKRLGAMVKLATSYNGRRIGVFMMQNGPGAENGFGGVAQAYAESVPILLLPAGMARQRRGVHPNFYPTRRFLMTSCSRRPRMPWSGATGAIARCKNTSIGYARKHRSAHASRWTCGGKPKAKGAITPSTPYMRHVLAEVPRYPCYSL